LQYERQTEQAKEEDALSTNVNSDKVFFDFLSKAYVSFLDGTDEAEGDALENELAQNFAEKDAAMMKEVERVRMANEKMEEEIVDLSDSKLEDLQEKRELLIKDLDKFKLLISNLEKHHSQDPLHSPPPPDAQIFSLRARLPCPQAIPPSPIPSPLRRARRPCPLTLSSSFPFRFARTCSRGREED
jgi:hypothetical protein